MHALSCRAHHRLCGIPVASFKAAQSMLRGCSQSSQLRASIGTVCVTNSCVARTLISRRGLAETRAASCLCRSPLLFQPRPYKALQIARSVWISHESCLSLGKPRKPQTSYRSINSAAAAGMQAPQAAHAQQQDTKHLAQQQGDSSHSSILAQADSALHPFLASPTEQPDRGRVDYSQAQRPLQVPFTISTACCCACAQAGAYDIASGAVLSCHGFPGLQ